ncbi:MAG: hypothetical protein ACK56F_06470 [bacterium]
MAGGRCADAGPLRAGHSRGSTDSACGAAELSTGGAAAHQLLNRGAQLGVGGVLQANPLTAQPAHRGAHIALHDAVPRQGGAQHLLHLRRELVGALDAGGAVPTCQQAAQRLADDLVLANRMKLLVAGDAWCKLAALDFAQRHVDQIGVDTTAVGGVAVVGPAAVESAVVAAVALPAAD